MPPPVHCLPPALRFVTRSVPVVGRALQSAEGSGVLHAWLQPWLGVRVVVGNGPSPGGDVAGAGPVPVQIVATVSPVLGQMWRGEPNPGADVAGVSPVPAQMWRE